MNTVIVGINHKSSPIEIREKFYLTIVERELLLSELKNEPSVSEALVLSTCTRTEIYANTVDINSEVLLRNLFKVKNINKALPLKKYFYKHLNYDAVKHLFNVASGLDSLIIGEKQILGQVKKAVELSRSMGTLGKQFNILSNIAIETGKKTRNETQIGYGGSSISWAAVAMAKKVLGPLEEKSVLIVGAGKMGKLTAGHLDNRGIDHLYIMNRSPEKALALSKKLNGIAVPFWDIKEILEKVDVCICSASAPYYLIDQNLIKEAMAERENKLVCIDISTPRNIDPRVANIDSVQLVTIDELDKVVEKNVKKRHTAVVEAEEIITNKIDEFYRKKAKSRLVELTGSFESSVT